MRETRPPAESEPRLKLLPNPRLDSSGSNYEARREAARREFNSLFGRLFGLRGYRVEIRRLHDQFSNKTTTHRHLPIYRPGLRCHFEEISQTDSDPNGEPETVADRYIIFERDQSWTAYQLRHGGVVIRVDLAPEAVPGWARPSFRLVAKNGDGCRQRPAGPGELAFFRRLLESDEIDRPPSA